MKHTNDIDELKRVCDAAELEAQAAMRARKAAIARSQEALKAASKARQRLVRALGNQDEGARDG